jgi:hypothetical protein
MARFADLIGPAAGSGAPTPAEPPARQVPEMNVTETQVAVQAAVVAITAEQGTARADEAETFEAPDPAAALAAAFHTLPLSDDPAEAALVALGPGVVDDDLLPRRAHRRR